MLNYDIPMSDFSRTECAVCGKKYNRRCDLSRHIKAEHALTFEEYCLKYVCTDLERGKCFECGKPTKFDVVNLVYHKYCTIDCERHSVKRSKLMSAKMQNQDWADIVARRNATNLKKYGTVCTLHADGIKDKKLQSIRQRYSEETGITDAAILNTITNVAQLPSVRKTVDNKLRAFTQHEWDIRNVKASQTKLKRYGDAHYTNREKAFKGSMSKPEKRMMEFLTNRGFDFKRNVRLNGKHFDFVIYEDGNPNIVIEIDGVYFHGLLSDPNGKHVRGETDYARFTKVPDGVKYIVCDDNKIEDCFAEILKVYGLDYEEWIHQLVDSMPEEFPYPEYTEKRMNTDWKHLQDYFYVKHSQIGMSLINKFHRSIWDAHVKGKLSPTECWKDKKLLERVIRNRVIYKSNLSSQQIAAGFNISKVSPKVSVFNPHLAKLLVQTFLEDVDVVFDPFSGFSGRMLGVAAAGKKYVGQDLSQIHVDESNRIIEHFNIPNVTVTCKDIFDSIGSYDALFTCPPYSLKEQWNVDLKDLSCDQWIDECMSRFKCRKYLFVVDTTEKYQNNIVYDIVNKSHFGNNTEHVVLITRNV